MKKIILTKGLPGSGKSTWAKEYQSKNPNTVRVNKDDLRSMLHGGVWSAGREKFVLRVRDFIVEQSLAEGHDVIVDDTNLHPKHKDAMQVIADKYDAALGVKDFTDVPVEECIKRDLERPRSVGQKVILGMKRQFLDDPTPKPPAYKVELPDCIICDIDGTIAENVSGRSPYDMDRVDEDAQKENIIQILWQYAGRAQVILFSGRDAVARSKTIEWLNKHNVPYHALYMRADGDKRRDSIVKRELYDQHIAGKYNVLFVLDDRDQVVEMWRRELGITCLQVNYGDF